MRNNPARPPAPESTVVPPPRHQVRVRPLGTRFAPDPNPRSRARTPEYLARRVERAAVCRQQRRAAAPFVAWDGEGYTCEDGTHVYNLLMNSAGGVLRCLDGISTEDAFNFILDESKRLPGSLHVCFASSYDINMMLRDVDEPHLRELQATGRADYGSITIEYIPRKYLYLHRYDPNNKWVENPKTGKWQINYIDRVVLWDVFGYFQQSFVEAIKSYLGSDWPLLALIAENKARRDVFRPDEIESIERYCSAELQSLVEIMNRLRDLMATADIQLSRWDGAGSIAGALLRRESVKTSLKPTDRRLELPVRTAYAGGRIELVQYGVWDGPLYAYDINSAYPAEIVNLPDMQTGYWTRATDPYDRDWFSLSLVRYRFSMSPDNERWIYPLFSRDMFGGICFPQTGYGWYWQPEVTQALEDGYGYEVEVVETWNYHDDGTKPMAFVRDLYDIRKKWKMEGNHAEMVLKLGINSLYGKMAQSAGYARNGRIPPYHQLEWAGFVTSSARAKLYAAAKQARDAIVFLATDGILSTQALDLDIGDSLGQWSTKTHTEAITVQAGVYRLRGHRDGDEPYTIEHARGFNANSVDFDAIRLAWRRKQDFVSAQTTRFVTLGSAVGGKQIAAYWRTWRTIDRQLAIWPSGKRMVNTTSRHNLHPEIGLEHSTVIVNSNGEGEMSYPYSLPWGSDYLAPNLVDNAPDVMVMAEWDESQV